MLSRLAIEVVKLVEKNLYVPSVMEGVSTLGTPMHKMDDEAVLKRLQ